MVSRTRERSSLSPENPETPKSSASVLKNMVTYPPPTHTFLKRRFLTDFEKHTHTPPTPKVTTFWCIRPKVEKSLKKFENAPCWQELNVPEKYVSHKCCTLHHTRLRTSACFVLRASHTHTHTHTHRCALKQRGVRHCCQRGHHKVCTPVPTRRKRPLAAHSQLPNKRPCLQGPARISTGLLRSPHQPPTPPAPKRRRPKTPPPPSPPAPVPRGLEETVAEDVARPLFVTRHGRANTLDT